MKKKPTKSDLKRLDAMSDANIDYSDIPALDTAFFRDARVVVPPGKKQLTVRLDADVLAWLQDQGSQSRCWNSGPSAIPSHLWDFVDSSPAGAPGRRIPADRQRDRRAAGLPLVRCTVARPGEGGSVAWCWLLRERLPA